jgi:Bacteriophage tail sheath protein
MPVTPAYPGVYIEEIPSGVRTITGVATSITAFIGRALRGPADEAVRVQSLADYERVFGDLWSESTLSYAVRHFFQHGGGDALIVRVFNGDIGDNTAAITLPTAGGNVVLEAASPGNTSAAAGPGSWGNTLRAIVDHDTADDPDNLLFNLTIEERATTEASSDLVTREVFRNLSAAADAARAYATVLAQQSRLVRVRTAGPAGERPSETAADGVLADGNGGDGDAVEDAQITGDADTRTGIHALDSVDLFNLLCIPPLSRDTDVAEDTWAQAADYCGTRRALLIIDPPTDWSSVSAAETGVNALRTTVGNAGAVNAAAYFPRLRMADPLSENRLADFAPCGAVAGIIARIDATRGVWKAPAGIEAAFSGVQEFTYKMTDGENGRLNPLGLNCLRSFPVAGNVVWGARSLAGADRLASEWKYLPVRRLALYIEESLYRGTQWAVFEPNDDPLWAQLRLNIGAFMQNLFRQGAFQGSSPREAYFVKCDHETTTQNDIDLGIVNVVVGFAPLKPAEFVIIKIQQMAGQIAA